MCADDILDDDMLGRNGYKQGVLCSLCVWTQGDADLDDSANDYFRCGVT